jgi:hypothetical protein
MIVADENSLRVPLSNSVVDRLFTVGPRKKVRERSFALKGQALSSRVVLTHGLARPSHHDWTTPSESFRTPGVHFSRGSRPPAIHSPPFQGADHSGEAGFVSEWPARGTGALCAGLPKLL